MSSRVSSTSEPTPSWRTWILHEFARYWYGLAVLMLLVFGVAEVARLGAPLGVIEIAGLVLLSMAVIAGGLVGYAMLWRRDTSGAQWIIRTVSKLRPTPPTSPAAYPGGPSSGGDREDEVPRGRA